MSSLADLVFINVLPPFLPRYHPYITLHPPLYQLQTVIWRPHWFLLHSSAYRHTHTHTLHRVLARSLSQLGPPWNVPCILPEWMKRTGTHLFSLEFLLLPPKPFTQWKRLIAWNTSGVISADSRSIAFDIKQTRDYCDDNKLCAKGLFAHVNGICSYSWDCDCVFLGYGENFKNNDINNNKLLFFTTATMVQ